MALLTVEELAARMRLSNPSASLLRELADLQRTANELIAINAPAAPDALKNEATVLFAAYVYDGPRGERGMMAAGRSAWDASGAQALLAPYNRTGLSVLDPGTVPVVIGAGITGNLLSLELSNGRNIVVRLPSGTGGLDQAAVDARVAAGVADWAETGNATAIPAAKLANTRALTLIATLTLTGSEAATLPAAVSTATWVVAPGAPAGFTAGATTGLLMVPRSLSDGRIGLLVRTSVGASIATDQLLPWIPINNAVLVTSAYRSAGDRDTWVLPFGIDTADDDVANRQVVRMAHTRLTNSDSRDSITVYGNGDEIPANSKIELFQSAAAW